MNKYDVVKKGKKEESFGVKAKMLQLSMEEQVEMLNKMYNGRVVFGIYESGTGWSRDEKVKGIQVIDWADNVISIDLPDLDCYNMDNLIGFVHMYKRLSSIKLPKTIVEIDLSKGWCHNINRIYTWDTTSFKDNSCGSNNNILEMVIIQSTTGGKPKIIRF